MAAPARGWLITLGVHQTQYNALACCTPISVLLADFILRKAGDPATRVQLTDDAIVARFALGGELARHMQIAGADFQDAQTVLARIARPDGTLRWQVEFALYGNHAAGDEAEDAVDADDDADDNSDIAGDADGDRVPRDAPACLRSASDASIMPLSAALDRVRRQTRRGGRSLAAIVTYRGHSTLFVCVRCQPTCDGDAVRMLYYATDSLPGRWMHATHYATIKRALFRDWWHRSAGPAYASQYVLTAFTRTADAAPPAEPT